MQTCRLSQHPEAPEIRKEEGSIISKYQGPQDGPGVQRSRTSNDKYTEIRGSLRKRLVILDLPDPICGKHVGCDMHQWSLSDSSF